MQLPYRKPGKFSQTPLDPFITEAKFNELNDKLARLKKSRPHAAHEVARLAELGDFSENVEYQLAKRKLRGINDRILILENQLKHAEVITVNTHTSRVQLGNTVTLDAKGKQKIYQILGSTESSPEKGIISYQSPIGSLLMGKKIGETITVGSGTRQTTYTITRIS